MIKFLMWTQIIIPVAFFAIILLVVIICCTIDTFNWHRKIKWLKSQGFERYLIGVPSFGGGAFYGWRKANKSIDERDLKRIKFKELKMVAKG